jgi:hypothetical protein
MTMNLKGSGRKRLRCKFKALCRHSPALAGIVRTEKPTKNLNQDSRSQGPRIETGTSRIRSRNDNHSVRYQTSCSEGRQYVSFVNDCTVFVSPPPPPGLSLQYRNPFLYARKLEFIVVITFSIKMKIKHFYGWYSSSRIFSAQMLVIYSC